MPNRAVPADILERFAVQEWRHGITILSSVYPNEWKNIIEALREFRLLRSEILKAGGNKSPVAIRLDSALYRRGWQEKAFDTKITVDDTPHPSPTHKVD